MGRGEKGVRGRGLSFLDFGLEPRGHGRLATGIYPLSLLRPHQTDSEGIKVYPTHKDKEAGTGCTIRKKTFNTALEDGMLTEK